MERCGKSFCGDVIAAEELRCQRERGHAGAHLADVGVAEVVKRYWWVPHTGESGINVYQGGIPASYAS